MKKGLRALFGVVCLVLGTILVGWLALNLFVERQPSAEGRSPLPAILLAIALYVVGVRQLRRAGREE